ncbi:MAG: ubiquinol-cytochrome c reductase iron-sulfur subunit [Saprospiraceae bacterium]
MMKRRNFVKNTCLVCLGGGIANAFVAGCKGIQYTTSILKDGQLQVPKTAFEYLQKKELRYRKWVVVKNSKVPFPIGVFRVDGQHFYASYLECTHQGCEVQPEGDYLQCPCHGSEFDNRGRLKQGPAEADLKTFTVHTDAENLYILLK